MKTNNPQNKSMQIKRFLITFITASTVILICSSSKNNIIERLPLNADSLKSETSIKLSDDFYLEILPEMELLSGVLSQTSWYDKYYKPLECERDQIYYQNLRQFFSNYRNDEAMQLLEHFTSIGFTYNAPPSFITFLSYPSFDIKYPYNDILIERAKGKENLEKFRLSLKKLNKESNFSSFFKDNISTYKHLLDSVNKELNAKAIANWYNNFFGYAGNEFHIIVMPGMYNQNYGNRISIKDKTLIYSMIASNGNCKYTPPDIRFLIIHEFGHSKIDTHVAALDKLIKEYKIDTLYSPVAEKMKKQGAYLTYQPFFCETINNAVTMLALKEIYNINDTVISDLKNRVIKEGEYLLDFTISELDKFVNNRDKYKRFDDFLPVLFKEYSVHKDSLLKLANK